MTRPKRLRHLPSLNFLRGFECAARHLSFTKAAQELNLTQSAISRQVKAIEEQLGLELFHRDCRSLTLTNDGHELYRTVALGLAEIEASIVDFSSCLEHRLISLSTTAPFAALWLIPRLRSFRLRYPDIDVWVCTGSEIDTPRQERSHLAVRYLAPHLLLADAHVLFEEHVVAVCSPAIAESVDHGLDDPSDLCRHTLLHIGDAQTDWPWYSWRHFTGEPRLKPAAALYFTQYDQLIQAAVEGHGIALGRRPLVDELIRQGRLVTLFDGYSVASGSYVLVENEDARPEAGADSLANWLLDECHSDG